MRARKISCLHCAGPTCRDPGYDGVKSEAPYCPACDAVWQKAACVVCGEVFLVDVTRHRGGHHCAPGTERRIEAGVIYVNRPQGATTGAWPGFQAFAGWKGSSSTGKAIGSFYYLPQYLREQSLTWVE